MSQALLGSYGASLPPIPSLTGIAALYSSFGIAAGWQNGSDLMETEDLGFPSTAVAPYPLDWASVTGVDLLTFFDQSGGAFNAAQGPIAPNVNTGTERFTYDGTQNLVAPAGILIAQSAITIYAVFSTDSLATAQTLVQLREGVNYTTQTQNLFAIYIDSGGKLYVSQSDEVTPTFNSKRIDVPNTNLHLVTAVFDRAISGAGATVAKLDNSTTGWSNIATDNMTGDFADDTIGIGLGKPLSASDAFLDGTFEHLAIFNVAHNNTSQTEWYDYLKYIYPTIP